MQFEIKNKDFLDALNKMSQVIPKKKNDMPVLKHVLLYSENGHVRATGTNLERVIELDLPVIKKSGLGGIGVEFMSLKNALKQAPKKATVCFSSDDKNWTLTDSNMKVSGEGIEYNQMPEGPKLSTEWIEIEWEEVKKKMSGAVYFCETDGYRPALCGVYLSQKKLCATTGRILIVDTLPCAFPDIIVPADFVRIVSKIQSQAVKYRIENNVMQIWSGSGIYTTTLIKGPYPDYMRVIPKHFNTTVVFNRQEGLSLIDKILPLTPHVNHEMHWRIDKGIKIFVREDNDNITTAELDAMVSGSSALIGLNAEYVKTILNSLETDRVEIHMIDKNRPIKIDGENGGLRLLMPIKIMD